VPAASIETGVLKSQYGALLGWEGRDYNGARRELNAALRVARSHHDASLEAVTLINRAFLHLAFLYIDRMTSDAAAAARQSAAVRDSVLESTGRYVAAHAAYVAGSLEDTLEHAVSGLGIAERVRVRATEAGILWLRGAIAMNSGAWKEAASFLDRGQQASPSGGRLLLQRMLVELEQGRFAGASSYMDEIVEQARRDDGADKVMAAVTALAIPWTAYVTGDHGRLDEAKRAAQQAARGGGPVPVFLLESRIGAGLIAVMSGDRRAARSIYKELANGPQAGSWYWRSVDRILGLLARTMGDLDRAAAHLRQATQTLEQAGWRVQLAWACSEYAEVLDELRATGAESSNGAEDTLAMRDKALQIARELGMKPLIERIISTREILKA
jgi:tetratricopeptide (TPR) repeat protein